MNNARVIYWDLVYGDVVWQIWARTMAGVPDDAKGPNDLIYAFGTPREVFDDATVRVDASRYSGMRLARGLLALLSCGCLTTSQPLEIGPDTYTMSATGYGWREGDAARQFAEEEAVKAVLVAGRESGP